MTKEDAFKVGLRDAMTALLEVYRATSDLSDEDRRKKVCGTYSEILHYELARVAGLASLYPSAGAAHLATADIDDRSSFISIVRGKADAEDWHEDFDLAMASTEITHEDFRAGVLDDLMDFLEECDIWKATSVSSPTSGG